LLHLRWNICPYCGAAQSVAQPVILPPEEVESPLLGMGTAYPVPELAAEAEADVAARWEGEKGEGSTVDPLAEDESDEDPAPETQPAAEAEEKPWLGSMAVDETLVRPTQEPLPGDEIEETPWWEGELEAESGMDGEAGPE
jgi:hypothetical protein